MTLKLPILSMMAVLLSPCVARTQTPGSTDLAPPMQWPVSDVVYAVDVPTTASTQQSPPFLDDAWHFTLALPLWIPGADGTLSILGREVSPDVGVGETESNLDGRFNFGIALHAEARRNRFAVFGDVMYADIRIKHTDDLFDSEASIRGVIGEAGVAYSLFAPEKTGFGAFRLDVMGGVRVSGLRLGVETPSFSGTENATIYDPFVGLRGELGLTPWLSLQARGDVGGFGINAWSTCDMSYNLQVGLDFKPADWCDIIVGYRFLKYEFAEHPDVLEFNATLSGPFVMFQLNL